MRQWRVCAGTGTVTSMVVEPQSLDGLNDTQPVSYTHLDVYKRQLTINGFNMFRPESIRMERSMFAILGYGKDGQGQLPPPDLGIRTYPCEGSTDVAPIMGGEWTDPAMGPGVTPGRDLGTQPTGSTIMVIGEVGKTLALQSVSLTRLSTGCLLYTSRCV